MGAFVLDFYAPEIRLAIEVDGSSHESDDATSKDDARQQLIEELKIEFLRLSNHDVLYSRESCIDAIRNQILKRREELHRSSWYGRTPP